jgi:hypothetical protein
MNCDFNNPLLTCPSCGYSVAEIGGESHWRRTCKPKAVAIQSPALPPSDLTGPGSRLAEVLKSLGLPTSYSGCQCAARTRQMNAWAVSGCREHRGEIIGWLQEAAAATSWTDRLSAAVAAISAPWFRPLDPYGSLVDEAIRLAANSPGANTPQSPD